MGVGGEGVEGPEREEEGQEGGFLGASSWGQCNGGGWECAMDDTGCGKRPGLAWGCSRPGPVLFGCWRWWVDLGTRGSFGGLRLLRMTHL